MGCHFCQNELSVIMMMVPFLSMIVLKVRQRFAEQRARRSERCKSR